MLNLFSIKGLKALLTGAALTLTLSLAPGCAMRPDAIAVNLTITQDPAYRPVILLNEVALNTYKVLGPGWTGSAVAIGPRTLVTAAHVVVTEELLPLEKVTLYRSLGEDYISEASVLKVDTDHDLALLTSATDLPNFARVLPEAEIAKRVTWMTQVVTCGHPLGTNDATIGFGNITSLDDGGYIRYNAHSLPGNSGGPVFLHDGTHWVVFSISQAGYTAGMGYADSMGLGVNPFTLAEFLR